MSVNVLVVDDEPVVRDVLSAWLGDEGYQCSSAAGVHEALERAASSPFDVALLDLMLPDGDGVWLARQLRASDHDMALIMVTGMRRFDAAVEGMRLNVMDYLLKPFTRQELVQSVDRAVRWKALRRPQIDRAQIEEHIARRTVDLARAFATADVSTVHAIEGLLGTIHRRNADAAAHASRVARMAATLGAKLGLNDTELAVLERGALLHDIGKAALPDALICKAGPLTEDEIALLRTHPQVGFAIISGVPSLQLPAEIVLASHEAWDGSGYPRGLAGADVPLGACITAVTDTYDALTWSRMHGEPVSRVRAAAELVRCAGTQFAPDVVQAWLRVLDLGE